jgi:zinc transporter 5/7
VGVIISTLLIQFYGWTGFDPIASLFIAILIAASVIPLVMDTGKVLALDVAERDVDIQRALTEVFYFLIYINSEKATFFY